MEKYLIGEISITKDKIIGEYKNMDSFYINCIEGLYGKYNKNINFYNLSKIIKQNADNDLTDLKKLNSKTGVYLFVNKTNEPVYIGIGGEKVNSQDLKTRIGQEFRAYTKKGEVSKYSKDSGATLSKNIREIDNLLENKKNSPDNSIEKIKSFSLITITVGEVKTKKDVLKSRALETILIALFHPKYNK